MCSTVAETTVQKIGAGLRQSQFVITVPKSIVRAEGKVKSNKLAIIKL